MYTLQHSSDVMMSANVGGGVNRPRCGIWFTDCEGVGSKGAQRSFMLGGPRWLSVALSNCRKVIQNVSVCERDVCFCSNLMLGNVVGELT